MDVLKQILEILRDLGIVIGIPTLIVLWLRMNHARIDALKEQIAFLKQTQYPQALAVIQAQQSLHEMELRQLRQKLREGEEVSAADPKEKKAIEEDIQSVQQSLLFLERLRQDITGTIESEAIRKFELFCKRLPDPDDSTPDYIFTSSTAGDGIWSVEVSVLERKGFVEIRDGNVFLSEKGKEIWTTLRNLEKQRE